MEGLRDDLRLAKASQEAWRSKASKLGFLLFMASCCMPLFLRYPPRDARPACGNVCEHGVGGYSVQRAAKGSEAFPDCIHA